MIDLILIGGGGHCKSVIDTLIGQKDYNIVGILDTPEKVGAEIAGVKIIGTDSEMNKYFKQGIQYAFLTVGSIGDVQLRKELYLAALNVGYVFPNIIDKSATMSRSVKLGEGNFIGKGSIINADSIIGDNCIINTGAIIEHDCNVGDFCHLSPGVTLSGSVFIGDNTHVGTNATIIHNIKIGANTIVGAGSVVVNNIKENIIAYGNPCREV